MVKARDTWVVSNLHFLVDLSELGLYAKEIRLGAYKIILAKKKINF